MRLRSLPALLLSLGLLTGCFPKGDVSQPIPQRLLPALQEARRLVVVLPGRGDDLDALGRSGIAQAVQAAWPDADVVLTGLALGYYMQGQAPERLRREVVQPARERGYREVWLLGASMGGMGGLMYDRLYDGEIDGLVLLAPYLGERELLREIRDAGGVAAWNAGPVPAAVDADNFSRELWRHLQGWQRKPSRARKAWLAYGDGDRLREADAILASLLPPDHVLVPPGGHTWTVWSPAARELLLRADAARGSEGAR